MSEMSKANEIQLSTFFQHDFSSVKSDSDSADTLYDDVIAVTPKVGVRHSFV